jgi:hypothetical protein
VTGIENDATGSSSATLSEDTGKAGNSTGAWANVWAAHKNAAIVHTQNCDFIQEEESIGGQFGRRVVNRFISID